MNLTKIFQIAAVSLVAALGFASPAQAGVTATFSAGATCGGATSASFSPGGALVQVSLCMTTTSPTTTCGHTIVLQAASAAENGRFVITSPFTLGANYSDPNSEVSQLPLAINNPPTTADFGGTSSAPVATGARGFAKLRGGLDRKSSPKVPRKHLAPPAAPSVLRIARDEETRANRATGAHSSARTH